MAFVVCAKWRANEGEAETIREILAILTPLVRAEAGCLTYIAHQSVDDPRDFFLYEQFVDEAAFQAHAQAEHFKEHVLDRAVPLLETRERALYTMLD